MPLDGLLAEVAIGRDVAGFAPAVSPGRDLRDRAIHVACTGVRELALPSEPEIPPLPRRYEKPVRDAWRGFWRSPVWRRASAG